MNKNGENKFFTVARLLIAIMIMYGLSWGYHYLISPMIESKMSPLLSLILANMVIPYVLGFPLFLFIVYKMPKNIRPDSSSVSASQFIKYAVVQSGLSMLVLIVINVIINVITKNAAVSSMDMQSNFIFYIVLLIIFNPIMEEIVFRKFVLERLHIYGDKTAVLGSAILFALPHIVAQGIPQFFYTFILGLIWGHITVKTNRLGYAIALHALSNFVGAIMPSLLAEPIAGHSAGLPIYMLVFNIIVPIIAIIIVVKNRKRINTI